MAMIWKMFVAALVLGSLGCDTEAEKQRQALEAEKARLAAEQAEKERQQALEAEKARLIVEQTEKERQEFFVQSGRWPSPDAVNDLHLAVKLNLPMLTASLIQQGADVNTKDTNFRTPLHWAVHWRNAVETVEVLLKHGADVNAKTRDGWTRRCTSRH